MVEIIVFSFSVTTAFFIAWLGFRKKHFSKEKIVDLLMFLLFFGWFGVYFAPFLYSLIYQYAFVTEQLGYSWYHVQVLSVFLFLFFSTTIFVWKSNWPALETFNQLGYSGVVVLVSHYLLTLKNKSGIIVFPELTYWGIEINNNLYILFLGVILVLGTFVLPKKINGVPWGIILLLLSMPLGLFLLTALLICLIIGRYSLKEDYE